MEHTNTTYGGFRKRLVAWMIDVGFYSLFIPLFINIYYYFKNGTTIGYIAMGLAIKNEGNESKKPSAGKLIGRFFIKGGGLLAVIGAMWLIITMIFYVLTTTSNGGSEAMLARKSGLNRLLGLLALISLILCGVTWITIPFSKKSQAIHDMIVKTVVIDHHKKNTILIIIGLVLFFISAFVSGSQQ